MTPPLLPPPLLLLLLVLLDVARGYGALPPVARTTQQLKSPSPSAFTGVLMLATKSVSRQVANNKLARRDYEILEDFEAGISLVGTEVKSCRAGKCTLRDGYCRIKKGECWLENVNIARHATSGSYFQHEELRPRRLLLHKSEIRKLAEAIDRKGLTVVPLAAYFNEKNCLKVKIGLARGKKLQDKREDLKRKDMAREVSRQLKEFS
jgi:SsrA-binding protein